MSRCKKCLLYSLCSRKDVYMEYMINTDCPNELLLDGDISFAIETLTNARDRIEKAIGAIQLAHDISLENADNFKNSEVKDLNDEFMSGFELELSKLNKKKESLSKAIDILKRFSGMQNFQLL